MQILSSIDYGVWTNPANPYQFFLTNPYQLVVQAMQNDNAYDATNLSFVHCNSAVANMDW
jgi:hypothetical protein